MGRDDRHRFGQPAERRAIEMIEMGMGDENQIELGQLADRQRRRDKPPRAERDQAQADADAAGHDRIGQHRHPADAKKHGRMADPRGGEFTVFPVRQIGNKFGPDGRIDVIEEAQAAAAATERISDAQHDRPLLCPVSILTPTPCHGVALIVRRAARSRSNGRGAV